MTEPVFQIVPQNKGISKQQTTNNSHYSTLIHTFITTSYGYYTNIFIKNIAQEAQTHYPLLRKCSLRKYLIQCTRKYMLTDLEIAFVGYYCQKNQWNCQVQEIAAYADGKYHQDDIFEHTARIFVQFNAYFVKSYIGDHEQFKELSGYICENDPAFLQQFQKWIGGIPQHKFTVSPRTVNLLYRNYSRNCQNLSDKKDYNQMVDTIIDLSTTYSIIPGRKTEKTVKQKDKKEKQRKKNHDPEESMSFQRQLSPHQLGKQKKNKNQALQEKQSIILHKDKQLDHYMPRRISRNSSQSKKNQVSLIDYRRMNRSSAIFQGLFGSRKNSDVPNLEPESPRERSREKKPLQQGNRISLNFRKKQKPNETVLGYINQSSTMGTDKAEKKHDLRERDNKNGGNNQSMGLFNIQSNLSSRSLVLPPIPFKATEEAFFFDKSRLD